MLQEHSQMRLIQLATVALTMVLGSALHADPADEELDPSMLRIEAGQNSILLLRASEAADALFPNEERDADVNDKCGVGVKLAALDLLALRNKLADKKGMLPSRVLRMKWPAWVFEPLTECPSPREIRRRLDWLGTQVQLVTEAVCSEAAKKTDDPLVCSVE